MSSGVVVNPHCLEAYAILKKRGSKYIIYRLSDDKTEITIEHVGELDKSKSDEEMYTEFVSHLPPNQCRWAVYDFDYEQPGEGRRSRLTLFSWSPDESNVREKFTFSSSKSALGNALEGIQQQVQCTEYPEVEYNTVLGRKAPAI